MKLHYFNQAIPDSDDVKLIQAINQKIVPKECLLGGTILEALLKIKKSPCDECQGPRDRCKGTPQKTSIEKSQDENLSRLKSILLGEQLSAIDELLRK